MMMKSTNLMIQERRVENEQNLQRGMISFSISRVHKDHSICTAVMGWTVCARPIVSGLASDNPMYFILPSSTSFFSSPILTNITNFNQQLTKAETLRHLKLITIEGTTR